MEYFMWWKKYRGNFIKKNEKSGKKKELKKNKWIIIKWVIELGSSYR